MKNFKLSNWRMMLCMLIVPMMALTSCKDDDSGDATPDKAKVLVVHASPSASGVDLLVDDSKVNITPLTFPNNTGYLDVNAGTRNFKVNLAGTTTTAFQANQAVEANKNYTIFAINAEANNSGVTVEPLVLTDDLTTPAAGKAHVRFVHLAPDAPAVDIVSVSGGTATPVFSNRSYKSYTAFTPLDAGTYNLEVRVAGTTTPALTIPNVSLAAGKIYTVFARGFLTPPSGNTNALGAELIDNTPLTK